MRSKSDEPLRRPARPDPRRETSDPPPAQAHEEDAGSPYDHPTVPPSEAAINLRELAVPSEPPPPDAPATSAEPPPSARRSADPEAPPASTASPRPQGARTPEGAAPAPVVRAGGASHAVTSLDPRLEAIEPAIAKGDWAAVATLLGSDEQAGRLPPNLGLIFALARKESDHDDAPASKGPSHTALAIRCMAGLFGVPEQSPIALVLAKRLLRKNPVSWQKRPAPPARVSVMLIAIAIALGGAIGWAISMGYVRFHWH